MTERKQNRELNTGRYTFDGDLGRMCQCGHTLGRHCAIRGRYKGKMEQDCMYGTQEGDDMPEQCPCMCFTPAKRKRTIS